MLFLPDCLIIAATMAGIPEIETNLVNPKAILTGDSGREFSPKVIFFTHLLASRLNDASSQFIETDYSPSHTSRDNLRNKRLRRQIQPALNLLTRDEDFMALAESVREEMMPGLLNGTCSIQLQEEERNQLRQLLQLNGAKLSGTSSKKMVSCISF